MEQLTIDGSVSIADRIEAAAVLYGPISSQGLSGFARFCRREGYLDGYPESDSIAAGDALYIKQKVFKQRGSDSLRRWICTGEGVDGEWLPRKRCPAEKHLIYCRMLKQKRDEIGHQLALELIFREEQGWEVTAEEDL